MKTLYSITGDIKDINTMLVNLNDLRALQTNDARYRRLRENWIDSDELQLHGRLSIIDVVVDSAVAYDAYMAASEASGQEL